MDSMQLDALVLRLVQNPHDEAAIAEAHREGQKDPKGYATFLEKVGAATSDPTLASYWLTEAAHVWLASLSDAHRAARTLMLAIDRDPTQLTPAERLAELYRQKGDTKALAALLERRAKALAPLAGQDDEMRNQLAAIHDELGRIWAEAPLDRPSKALEHFRRAIELEPANQYAIYSARELCKAQGQFADAIPYYALEQALAVEPERKFALYADEGEVRQSLGDLAGATSAFREALKIDPSDPTARQQLATVVLERFRAGDAAREEISEASTLFIRLAAEFPGEHGLAYSLCALELTPGQDQALELALGYGAELGRGNEVVPYAQSYLDAKPSGALREQAARLTGESGSSAGSRALPDSALAENAAGADDGLDTAALTTDEASNTIAETAITQAVDTGVLDELSTRDAFTREAPAQNPFAEPALAEAAASTREIALSEAADTSMNNAALSESETTIADGSPGRLAELGEAAVAAQRSPVQRLLAEAASLDEKNRKNEAYKRYREVLQLDPAEASALRFVEGHLKRTRKFAELRDLLLDASQAAGPGTDALTWLKEVASICETHLRDFDGAISAWKRVCEIDPDDDANRSELKRLLERAGRWDDYAAVLEEEARLTIDVEARIALEKSLAKIHETKRKDPVRAGEAWARIASLLAGDENAIFQAIDYFEQAERSELAARVIAENVAAVSAEKVKVELYKKLGNLRETMGELQLAGDALREGALETGAQELWGMAEAMFKRAEAWESAASVVHEQAQSSTEPSEQGKLFAREAGYLLKTGDQDNAILLLERAADLDPDNDDYSSQLEGMLTGLGRQSDLALFFLRRAESLEAGKLRQALRKRAARIQFDLGQCEASRESLELALLDGDDAEALTLLADEAESRNEVGEAVDYLKRLVEVSPAKDIRLAVLLRQAELLAQKLDAPDGAIDCFNAVLALEPQHELALTKVAELQLQSGNPTDAAAALEQLMSLLEDGERKLEVAQRLAALYQHEVPDDAKAKRALTLVHELDPGDLEVVSKLVLLAEESADWERFVEYQAELISVEGDEQELSRMQLRLAQVLRDELHKDEEAFALLGKAGDEGDVECRRAFVVLGDELGKKAAVAERLVSWYKESAPSPERTRALHEAFERYADVGADVAAADVAKELARTRVADSSIAFSLEEIAVRLRDVTALHIAYNLRTRDLSSKDRAAELVRQAEVMVQIGVEPLEAVQHGEQGLIGVGFDEVDPLLARLAALVGAPGHVIDLYERQVGRMKGAAEKLDALGRAATVAAQHQAYDRAREFFEIALAGGVQEETLEALAEVARAADASGKRKQLQTTLVEAMAAGGQGSRDGGRTRSALLRRAAVMALTELGDERRAFEWIADALVTHVSDEVLDTLLELAGQISDFSRADAVLTRALTEVFDGPLVRKLLTRRGRLRRDQLKDAKAAAEDLKRLFELSPGDAEITAELASLYTELEDYKGSVQLFEDQILRSRDTAARIELARQVAVLWRDRLDDPRETADAWRRVLRMKSNDVEATEGLALAKANMLRRRSEVPSSPAWEPPQKAAVEAARTQTTPAAGVINTSPLAADDARRSVLKEGDEESVDSGPPSSIPTTSNFNLKEALEAVSINAANAENAHEDAAELAAIAEAVASTSGDGRRAAPEPAIAAPEPAIAAPEPAAIAAPEPALRDGDDEPTVATPISSMMEAMETLRSQKASNHVVAGDEAIEAHEDDLLPPLQASVDVTAPPSARKLPPLPPASRPSAPLPPPPLPSAPRSSGAPPSSRRPLPPPLPGQPAIPGQSSGQSPNSTDKLTSAESVRPQKRGAEPLHGHPSDATEIRRPPALDSEELDVDEDDLI